MKFIAGLVASLILAFGTTGTAAGTSVLFIGNSFLFGSGSAVRFYRADTVTDLNSEGIGGVPALFKSFTQQAGLDFDVSLETRGGMGLDFHLENKLGVIGRRGWDTVIMHGYSTLDAATRLERHVVVESGLLGERLEQRRHTANAFVVEIGDGVSPVEANRRS